MELEKSGSQGYECHNVDQQQRKEESISDILGLERTGIGTICTPLNHNSNTPTTGLATTQDSFRGEDSLTEPVSGIACDVQTKLDSVPVPQESNAAPKAAVTPSLSKYIC